MPYPFRVFISYVREDAELVDRLVRILRRGGCVPVWDKKTTPGRDFTDEIKEQIATAHLIMPLITPRSVDSAWVNQEVGFAVGLDLPVVAVALGRLPPGMIAGVQALTFSRSDWEKKLADALQGMDLSETVRKASQRPALKGFPTANQVAAFPEERARLLVRYASAIKPPARVRQRAYYSSFSMPSDPRDPDWAVLDSETRRSRVYRGLLSDERRSLEKHAIAGGCSLVLRIPGRLWTETKPAGKVRMARLLAFLHSMAAKDMRVVFAETPIEGNLTILGDWLMAAALPPRAGSDYTQTFFSSYGPTVFDEVERFDRELDERLRTAGIAPEDSRDAAIARITMELRR